MATATLASAPPASPSMLQKVWQDLQPTPGRLSATLRIVLATIITLLALMILQMPFAYLGLYYVFLVARDSPSISVRSSVLSLLTLGVTIAVELGLVILTDNDPMARVIGVAAVTFIAGMLMYASTLSPLASTFGFIFCTVIALWELPTAADSLVKTSLYLIGAVSIAIGASIAVEYVFGAKHPVEQLEEQIRTRYQALESMFTLYAQDAGAEELGQAAVRVARLASAGQSGMQQLYNQIVDRNLDPGDLQIGSRVRITMLAQLMDVSAAFGLQHGLHNATDPATTNPELRQRCARIAEHCHQLMTHTVPGPEAPGAFENGLLDRVEGALHVLLSMPLKGGSAGEEKLVAVPAKSVPLIVPGGFRNKDTIGFALKLSLCATLCYIFYHAVDYPGISTSVTTVIITGLSTSGAMKQKLLFRIVGSLIGGLILGLGCTTFIFPYMDTITSLVILIGSVAFMSAWCATGRQFNYVGLQIAFSFYIVAFEGFSAPTELAPARDRFIGVLLALGVMWFVFDQIWPVRTVTAMRRSLASILRSEANFFRLIQSGEESGPLRRRVDALRDQIGKTMANIRTMNDAVEYEYGVNRAEHAHSAQTIIKAGLTAVALFWNQLTVLEKRDDRDFVTEPGLMELRRKLAAQLDSMADSVCDRKPFAVATSAALADPSLLENPRYREYTQNALEQYGELQKIIGDLSVLV
jgi:multidrug resistance protein MdtO